MTTKRAEQIAAMSDDQLFHLHSKCMTDLELIWLHVAEELDKRAGDDRTGETAQLAAAAHANYFDLKAFHRRADGLGNRVAGFPVARSGER